MGGGSLNLSRGTEQDIHVILMVYSQYTIIRLIPVDTEVTQNDTRIWGEKKGNKLNEENKESSIIP